MNNVTPAQVAWLAGIFEGEGHVRYQGRGLQVYLGMTDSDVISSVAAVTGVGVVRCKAWRGVGKYGPHKPIYHWRVSNRTDSGAFLRAIYPWLGARRRSQVDAAMSMLPPVPLKKRKSYRPAPDNTCGLVLPRNEGAQLHLKNGELPCESCRLAQREYYRQWRAKRKARAA